LTLKLGTTTALSNGFSAYRSDLLRYQTSGKNSTIKTNTTMENKRYMFRLG